MQTTGWGKGSPKISKPGEGTGSPRIAQDETSVEQVQGEAIGDEGLDQKLEQNRAEGKTLEGQKVAEIDRPHGGRTITHNPDAGPVGDLSGVPNSEQNLTPALDGIPETKAGKPIPSTENRTADRDDLKVQDVDTTDAHGDFADVPTAQYQKPDPLVLSGRQYDVLPQTNDRAPKDLLEAASDAVTEPGLQGQERKPGEPAGGSRIVAPRRPVTAPPSSVEPTLPSGAEPQPGGPRFAPRQEHEMSLDERRAKDRERNSNEENALFNASHRGGFPDRSIAPRAYLAGQTGYGTEKLEPTKDAPKPRRAFAQSPFGAIAPREHDEAVKHAARTWAGMGKGEPTVAS
jgi:hypothetical protein